MKGAFAVFMLATTTAILAVRGAISTSAPEPIPAVAHDSQDAINMVGLLAAQHDSINKNADSIRLETCRGGTINTNGTCSGRKYAPRTTRLYTWSMRIKHHKYRADSIMNQYMIKIVPPAPASNTGYAATTVYNSDSIYMARPGVDTVTVCVVLQDAQGVKKLGYPPVRLGQGHADSTGWGRRGGNPLSQMCARAIEQEGVTIGTDSLSAIPVNWVGVWFERYGRRLFRPYASIAAP